MGVLCGYVFFGDVPDGWSVAGMGGVVLVGISSSTKLARTRISPRSDPGTRSGPRRSVPLPC